MSRVFFGRRRPSRIEIVYAAGLFDGEGSIAVARHGEFSARIQMGDVECLRRVHKAFKGTLWDVGYRDGRRCSDGRKRRPMHQLTFQGYEGLWFIEIILKEIQNPRQKTRIRWLLSHWYDYSTEKHQKSRIKKPPRWQMYIDFHKANPGFRRKKTFKNFLRPDQNIAHLARRRERYKTNRLKVSDYIRGPYRSS